MQTSGWSMSMSLSLPFLTRAEEREMCMGHKSSKLSVQRDPRRQTTVGPSRALKKSTPPLTLFETTLHATPGQRTRNCQMRRARRRKVQVFKCNQLGQTEASSVHTSPFFVKRRPRGEQDRNRPQDPSSRHAERVGKPSTST